CFHWACLHVFFFLAALPDFSPPLFPYPTLFRSLARMDSAGRAPEKDRGRKPHRAVRPGPFASRAILDRSRRAHARLFQAPGRCGDRKSTRPNSSHGSISYAVFCLKKKTILNVFE